MHRQGVQALRDPDGVSAVKFASAFPDAKAWFRRLAGRSHCSTLNGFFSSLEYVGRPELFSMFACLFGNPSLRVRPAWLLENLQPLRRKMMACYSFAWSYGGPGAMRQRPHRGVWAFGGLSARD